MVARRPSFPTRRPVCRTRRVVSDARCTSLAPPCCRPTAALIVRRSATSTIRAGRPVAFRWDTLATPRFCTDQCNDRDLVGTACTGLSTCDISEIVKAETAASCSCCASQLCGCNADGKTNSTIATLNEEQRNLGITPQCDINDTLCGSP